MYGLKGSIDMTISVKTGGQQQQIDARTMPFEIKTGKQSQIANHRAQTILYTLLLSDRYDMPVIQGILYYLDFSEAISVPVMRLEIGALIRGRNYIAQGSRDPNLPIALTRDTGRCNSCFSVKPCFLFFKATDGDSSKLAETNYEIMTAHIGETEKKFLLHWDKLLTMEEKNMARFRNELWLMSDIDRQAMGRCFASLRVDSRSKTDIDGQVSKKIDYKLSRVISQSDTNSFFNSQINIGEPILVSDNLGHIALASGILKAIGPDWIAVSVDREFDSKDRVAPLKDIRYRVDKDDFSNTMLFIRNNLIQLLMHENSEQKRRLIVNLDIPKFIAPPTLPDLGGLNIDQKKAVKQVLAGLWNLRTSFLSVH